MPSIRFAFWTRTFAFPTLVALALFPLACITDGNTKKSEVVVREHNQEMKSIQSEKGFYISLASDWDCNADPDTLTYASDTTYYQIENGKLWAWQGGACLAHGYTGSNNGLIGHWEIPYNQVGKSQESKLSPDAPENCKDLVERPSTFTWVQDGKLNLDISEKKVSTSITGTAICLANQFAYYHLGGEPDSLSGDPDRNRQNQYQITAMNCESAEVNRVSDNQIITVTSQLLGDSSLTLVQVGDKSCRRVQPFFPSRQKNRCVVDTAAEAEMAQFNQCLSEIDLP